MNAWVAAAGWAGQGAFAWRTLTQWIASERAGTVVVPRSFWAWSLVGTVLSLAYAFGREDPVLVLGALATGGIFARNAWLSAAGTLRGPDEAPPLWPLVAGLALFGGLALADKVLRPGVVPLESELPLAWSVVGFTGQAAWSGRFVAQWWASERRGVSVLPASFFTLGLVGTLLMMAYAIRQADAVNVAAFAPNALPYGRNLWILRHGARKREAAAARTSSDVD